MTSKFDQLLKFVADRDDVEKEIVKEITERIEGLKKLGIEYTLVKGSSKKGDASKGHVSSDKPCPVCRFQTDPPHDKRKHRHQEGFEDRPFNASKLRELNLTKAEE